MEHDGAFCGHERPDIWMKVATYRDYEKVATVNVSELARKILAAISAVDDEIPGKLNLPHFQGSVGIPDLRTLEKNLKEFFAQWNMDCLRRMRDSETEKVVCRVEKLAKELGIEVEEVRPDKVETDINRPRALNFNKFDQ